VETQRFQSAEQSPHVEGIDRLDDVPGARLVSSEALQLQVAFQVAG
jgi:hypothetical protein